MSDHPGVGSSGAGDLRRLRDAAAGDAAAFVSVVEEGLPAAFRLALAILGDDAEAAEATHDSVVAAWRELPRLDDPERFEEWVRRILVDECRMRVRRRAKAPEPAESPELAGLARPAGSPEPSGALDRDRLLEWLESEFERLDADDRVAIVLHELYDRSPVEIGAALHLPSGTVRTRIREVRLALRATPGGDPGMPAARADELLHAMLERRADRPVPERLLERSVAAVVATPQAGRTGRRAGAAGAATGRLAIIAGLALLAVGVVAGALLARPLLDGASSPGGTQSPVTGDATASPSTPGSPSPTDAPAPTGRSLPTTLEPGAVAVVTDEGARLRVRSAPSVGEESRLLTPVLRAGRQLFVVAGPVEADGYTWYQVQPSYEAFGPFGWVAAADKEGMAWIELANPSCPAEPGTAALAALTPFEFLACYGSRPVTIVADTAEVSRPYEGGPCELVPERETCQETPSWLMSEALGILVDLDPQPGVVDELGVYVSPDAVAAFAGVNVAEPMLLTGSLDAPEAEACRLTNKNGRDLVPPEQAILRCRTRFVVRAVSPAAGAALPGQDAGGAAASSDGGRS